MINLASRKTPADIQRTDAEIDAELFAAGIEIVRADEPPPNPEIHTHLHGRLGPFTFTRAWYYWVVRGPVPLAMADEMYAQEPYGRRDVRVAGHCGCPPPTEWAEYFDAEGRKLIRPWQRCADPGETMRAIEAEVEATTREVSTWPPTEYASAVVDCYHIDTQAGLRVFVDAARRHGLVTP